MGTWSGSREVLRCRGLLGELVRANSVILLWVPGHSRVLGNDKADSLANGGARAIRATRCSVGLPACYLDELLEKWLGKIVLKRWQEEKGLRKAKLLIGVQPSESWWWSYGDVLTSILKNHHTKIALGCANMYN